MTSASEQFISVVLPIHDESGSLAELVSRTTNILKNLTKRFEIVLVDDGSRDDSLKQMLELAKNDSHLSVVELSRNFGQTPALAAGIDHARGDVIVTMDADLQHKPEEIPRFIEKLNEGFDIVSGWREVRTDGFVLRRIPSYCANRLMRLMSGVPVKDFASTFKAYRADMIKRIELFGELHRFIPVLASRIGARITEIPISVAPRTQGKSKYGISRVFGVFEDLVFLEFYSNYLTKPIRAFGRLFVVFFLTGFSISSVLMILWLFGVIPGVIQHAALLMFSIFLMVIGVQFLVAGILAELICRIYLNTSKSKIYQVRNLVQSKL